MRISTRRILTNIYKRKHRSGKVAWMVRWKDPQTARWVARTAGKTEDEAALIEARIRENLAVGREPFPEEAATTEPLSLAQVAECFYQSPKFLAGKPLWQAERRRLLTKDILPYFGRQKFAALTRDHVLKFYLELKGRKLSHASIQKYHVLLCTLGDVFSEKAGVENSVRKIRDYKKLFPDQASSRDINFLTIEELEQLFAAARVSKCKLLYPFTKFLANTGLRRGEALALKWTDIDEGSGFVHIRQSKSGRARIVPFEQSARDALEDLDRSHGHVFTKPNGERYNDRYLLKPLKRAGIDAGITKRIDLHTLRHSYGSNKLRQGWGMKKVSMILGHADIKITAKVYSHLLDGDLKIRDEFAFDFHGASPNDENLKSAEMSEIQTEMISRLSVTSEEALRETMVRALSGMAPGVLSPNLLTSANELLDSTTTAERPALLRNCYAGRSASAATGASSEDPETVKARIASATQAFKSGVRGSKLSEPLTLAREYPAQWRKPRKSKVELANPTKV